MRLRQGKVQFQAPASEMKCVIKWNTGAQKTWKYYTALKPSKFKEMADWQMFHERLGYKVIQPTKHMDAYRSVPFSLFFQPGKVTQTTSLSEGLCQSRSWICESWLKIYTNSLSASFLLLLFFKFLSRLKVQETEAMENKVYQRWKSNNIRINFIL